MRARRRLRLHRQEPAAGVDEKNVGNDAETFITEVPSTGQMDGDQRVAESMPAEEQEQLNDGTVKMEFRHVLEAMNQRGSRGLRMWARSSSDQGC